MQDKQEKELISKLNLLSETNEWLSEQMLLTIKKLDKLEKIKGKNYKTKRAKLENELKVLVAKVELEIKEWERADIELEEFKNHI